MTDDPIKRLRQEKIRSRKNCIEDLVERLRPTGSMSHVEVWETFKEAADRIEELEATTRQQKQEIDDIRKVLADIVLLSVMMPILPDIECAPRHVINQARMMIDHSDLSAAAARARPSEEKA